MLLQCPVLELNTCSVPSDRLLWEHEGGCEARRSHWSKIWLKHFCVIAMRSFLRNVSYCGCAEQALLPNPHHLGRFMDNLVLTQLKVQNKFSYLLIPYILTPTSSKACKKLSCELHFVPPGRTLGDVLCSSQAKCSRSYMIFDSKGSTATACLTWHSSVMLRTESVAQAPELQVSLVIVSMPRSARIFKSSATPAADRPPKNVIAQPHSFVSADRGGLECRSVPEPFQGCSEVLKCAAQKNADCSLCLSHAVKILFSFLD